ncbi:rod shape-determining protein [Geoglobus acetivorans]|uniref:Rod shape-determining protein n=1 Tax=Geoglobus acetivorans TaxID=565033 RepID=A0ABZ3H687_GEOAI|nr:rod shape-determining protein [Geoglobus acetivorans]
MAEGNGGNETNKKPGVIPVGIKVGSQKTVIAMGDEIHVEETCIREKENPVTGTKDYIIGNDASELYGDDVTYMLRGGLPATEEEAELLRIFLGEVAKKYGIPENSYVTYAIPSTELEEGIGLFKKVVSQVPIGWSGKEVWNDSFLASLALPEGLGILDRTYAVINLGSTTTEFVAVRKGEIVFSMVTGEVSGDVVDRWIKNEIMNLTRGAVNVDLSTAREYKEKYANLLEWKNIKETVQLFEKGQFTFRLDEAVNRPVERYLDGLIDFVTLEVLPSLAEFNFKIYRLVTGSEFVLTGGMARIPGLKEKFETKLSDALGSAIKIRVPDDPLTASAKGALTISTLRIKK